MEKPDNQIDKKTTEYFRHRRQEMLEYIPSSAITILELGCGAGEFGAILKSERKTSEIWGMELMPEAAKMAAHKLDRVFVGNIETDEITLPEGYFDCIVCNDILEHFVDPWQVLSRLRANLAPNGAVVASIPNIRSYSVMRELIFNKEWQYLDSGVLDRTHLRFFTAMTIKDMFEKCGYRMEKLEGINACKYSWKFRMLNKIFFNDLEDMRYLQFACVARVETDLHKL